MVGIEKITLEYINKVESIFCANKYNGEKTSEYFHYQTGNIPVILSAPHTVRQERVEGPKYAEFYTGAIVKMLGEITGCHVIYKTRNAGIEQSHTWLEDYRNQIKMAVETYNIKLLIDIHGAERENKFNIDLGTDFGRNIQDKKEIVENIIDNFIQNGISDVTENYKFFGNSMHCLTRFVSQDLGIPGVQVEINRALRDPENDLDKFNRVFNSLKKSIISSVDLLNYNICEDVG